ncbi:hypothetical protein ACFFX0_05860 [Citricoccus parietis]|uniref:Uncharacterized protein n=1 Tax=Citricoccus parietis TaxID=592307 RepID=A0ABV5FVM9_9MICC
MGTPFPRCGEGPHRSGPNTRPIRARRASGTRLLQLVETRVAPSSTSCRIKSSPDGHLWWRSLL